MTAHQFIGTNAYWSTGEGFADVIGLTVRVTTRTLNIMLIVE